MISMTPDHYRKVGTGMAPTPIPFLTPRPERRRPSSRGSEWGLNRQDGDREVNVQVILRCRPLSDDEQRNNVPKGISCNEQKREVSVTQSIATKQLDRVFTFDKVFGPKAQQRSIYDQAIAPIVDEVLDGFNCTVFAYGQTGTGKTYTMEGGGMRSKGGELPAEAGVIPRAVRHIFDKLEAQNADYSMGVTFLELYNEEVTDLLAPEDNSRFVEDKQKKSVALLEDGKGCVIIRGLEEEAVYSANDIYNVLERGAAKRRTADTSLNKRSSRSHSVFTITIHVKESVGDEELIKCGKLNLVDLAGSENISRSGAREGRAREAGEINKSLLTLGRVINALVEHSVHIPYRDSKLTRLLRDSLGGKTKTCIIATVSSSAHSLEETLSTLDYAHRAKNIKNKPEANQKVSKIVLLKELYQEIERMKQDVRAAREKNGVYVPHERHSQEEAEKKARNERIEQLEIELSLSRKEVDKYREMYISEEERKLGLQTKLQDCKVNLENTNKALLDLENKNRQANLELKEKDIIISKLLQSEASLIDRAKELRSDLENATEDITALHAKIDQKGELEAKNHELVLTFGSQLDQSLKDLHKTIIGSVSHQQNQVRRMEEHMGTFLSSKDEATKELETKIRKMSETYNAGATTMRELAAELGRQASRDLEQINSKISSQTMAVENFLETAALEAKEVLSNMKNSLARQQELLTFSTQLQEDGLQRTMVSTQMISKETIGFFNELYSHSSKLMSILEESKNESYHHLVNFEKTFKEQSLKEEQEAADKIATILAGLTAKKTTMVSEALKSMHNRETEVDKTLQKGLSDIQQVSTDGKNTTSKLVEEAEKHILSDTHVVAQSRGTMEEHMMGWSELVGYSSRQWEKAGNSIKKINNTGITEIQSTVTKMIEEIESVQDQYSFASLSNDKEFDTSASCLLSCANDSFKLDIKTKQEIDFMSTQGIDQLESIQTQHKENVSSITNRAEQFLNRDYMVDRDEVPVKQVIAVPSVASIEKLRTALVFGDISGTKGSENISKHIKVQQEEVSNNAAMSPTRAPFGDVN